MTTGNRRYLKPTIVLLAAAFLFTHLLFLLLPDVLETWNDQLYDRLIRYRSRTPQFQPVYDGSVVHLNIDNETADALGLYLTRSHYARVVRSLSAMKSAAQVYDFIFAFAQDPEEDADLINAVSDSPNVYFGASFRLGSAGAETNDDYIRKTSWRIPVDGSSPGARSGGAPLITFEELAVKAAGLGSLTIEADPDGVVRRLPLLVRYGDAFYPSLPLRVVCDYLGVTPDRMLLRPGRSLTLKDARRPGQAAGDVVIPIDERGYFRINFTGPWERMTRYSFLKAYDASSDRDLMDLFSENIAGRIVVISDVSASSRDIGAVPSDPNFPMSGLMANVMHNILNRQFLREMNTAERIGIELALLACIFGFAALRLGPVLFSTGVAGLAGAYVALSATSFLYAETILPIVGPVLLSATALILNVGYRYIIEERDKSFLRRTLNAYFPPKVVERIVQNPQMIASAGERKELTIMFSDVAGFTQRSSTMAPDDIRQMLNEYFEAMTEIVFKYEGTVDKFMGDGLMVFFGDPEPQPDHALRCVRMAIDMQRKIRDAKMPFQIRIGINTGVVVVGNMGSAKRLSYTVLGSDVNLAQRLESNAPVGGILISKRTYELLEERIPVRPAGKFKVKGFDEAVEAYEVLQE